MPNNAVTIENELRHKETNDNKKSTQTTNTTVPDWGTLWKDENLREDFVTAVRMHEEWIRQAEWLNAAASSGRSIQKRAIDEHFEKCDDVMTRWAKQFAPRKKRNRGITQVWYSEECIEAKNVCRMAYEEHFEKDTPRSRSWN